MRLSIIYHSGYGHTARVAEHVSKGALTVEGLQAHLVAVDNNGQIKEEEWDLLNQSDGIVFGSPTYMGSASGPFKVFMDQSSKPWFQGLWKDKLAAGFTNSGSLSGDKLSTLLQLAVFGAQHGMIWVGNHVATQGRKEEDINRISSYLGLMTQSDDLPADQTPPSGDIKTAEIFGERIAKTLKRFKN